MFISAKPLFAATLLVVFSNNDGNINLAICGLALLFSPGCCHANLMLVTKSSTVHVVLCSKSTLFTL